MREQFKNFTTTKQKKLLEWQVTPWKMSAGGGWIIQPVILVEGRKAFIANHPDDYIAELERLHHDPELCRGPFNTFIGQLKDALEQFWVGEHK